MNKTNSGRERSKNEKERWNAAEEITALITKLLRKTRLQVHVVIEVIHCKSPKHLLTEMVYDIPKIPSFGQMLTITD